jgi:hypothetical protein
MDPELDIPDIIDACTGVGDVLDELTLLRVSLRLYAEGYRPADAVAMACKMLSDSITKTAKP